MTTIEQAGILAIASRLQRLSEQIRKGGQLVYQAHGIDFEPKWFPVVYTLHLKPALSVIQIAAEIGYSHPSTISLLKELEAKKLVVSLKDKDDERKRLVQLTEKGRELVKQMEPVWNTLTRAIADLVNTENNLMKAIEEVEVRLQQQSFSDRAQQLGSY
jgi:DNA-binding MarR family transcriptional regulator